MTMALSFSDQHFKELTFEESEAINGGGWADVVNATLGTLSIGHSLAVGVIVGVTVAPVAGAVVGAAMIAYGVHALVEVYD